MRAYKAGRYTGKDKKETGVGKTETGDWRLETGKLIKVKL